MQVFPDLTNVEMNKTPQIEKLASALKRLRYEKAELQADDCEVPVRIMPSKPYKRYELFNMLDFNVHRIKFPALNCTARRGSSAYYRNLAAKEDFERRIDEAVGKRASLEVVMASILLDKGSLGKKESSGKSWKEYRKKLNHKALGRLYDEKELAKTTEEEIAAGKTRTADYLAMLARIKRKVRTQIEDPFDRYRGDQFVANNSDFVTIVAGYDIFIAVDQNDAVIAFFLARAVRLLFSDKVAQDVYESSQKWAFI